MEVALGQIALDMWQSALLNKTALAGSLTQTGVAAQSSVLSMRNPAGSTKNTWLYNMQFRTSVADQINMGFNSPPVLAGGGAGRNMATGLVAGNTIFSQTTTASPSAIQYFNMASTSNPNQSFVLPWIIMLVPNTEFYMWTLNVNEAFFASFQYIEQ